MSYILDALRKAETERALNRASCIVSPRHKSSARKGLSAKRVVIIVMAIACAMALTWWWARYTITAQAQASSPDTSDVHIELDEAAPAGTTAVSAIPQTGPRLSPQKVETPPASVSVPSIKEALPVTSEAAPVSVTADEKPARETVALSPIPQNRQVSHTASDADDAATVQDVPSISPEPIGEETTGRMEAMAMIADEAKALGMAPNAHSSVEALADSAQTTDAEKTSEVTPVELPPLLRTLPYRFQSTLPKMVINAQAYADEVNARFVIINMKKYREGERTEAGIVVEEIAEAYLVMSYQGQVFRMQR